MIPITVIPIILAIAVIPPVLSSDSDPFEFIQGMIPSFKVACAGNFFFLCNSIIPQDGVEITVPCIDNGCTAAGGTCEPEELGPRSVNAQQICFCKFPSVGGWFLQVDKPALLVAGAQSIASWMLPVIVSAIGIGIVIARKF